MKNHLIKRKLNSKVIATILGIALLFNLLSTSTIYAEGISGQLEDSLVIPTGDYYINQDNHNYKLPEGYSGVILISKDVNHVKVTGFSKSNTHKNTAIDIEQRNKAIELTIENLNISAPAGSDGIDFSNTGNYDNKLYISGTNEMLVLNEGAGIHIPENVRLTIDKAPEIIEDIDGELTIQGGDYAAGIGGGKDETGGDIIINGGKINVGKKIDPEHYGVYEYSTGAGIGGGYNGDGGNIIINGGIITTFGGRRHETNNDIPSSAVGAGLGGGYKGSGGNITINGGNITAYAEGGGQTGAGIGSGALSDMHGVGTTINITGGKVIAYGGNRWSNGSQGAGIGGGCCKGGTINISGGEVIAYGGTGAAGIGGGIFGDGGSINISGGLVISEGYQGGAGIGGGMFRSAGNIIISGGVVIANSIEDRDLLGAGIGSGGPGFFPGETHVAGSVVIKGNPTVIATAESWDADDVGDGYVHEDLYPPGTTIKDQSDNDLKYIRLELIDDFKSISNAAISVDGADHITNDLGLTGFFRRSSNVNNQDIYIKSMDEKINIKIGVSATEQCTRQTINLSDQRANLIGLSLEDAVLEPAFSSSENSYIAHVTTTRESITITPSTTSSSITLPDTTTSPSSITIKVNGEEVVNNNSSERISLKLGDNLIPIVTSSYDLTEESYSIAKIYTVNVIKPPVRINFDSNGGSSVDLIEAEFESIIEEPEPPVRKGYSFNGWYKNDSLTTLWDFKNDTAPAEDITLYAKWKARKRRSSLPSTPNQESDDLQLNSKNIITNDEKATIEETEEDDLRTIKIRSKKALNNFKVTIKGNYLKELEDNLAKISITSDQTSYNTSAKDIDIENIIKKLNIEDDEMDSLEIDIEIKGLDEKRTSEIKKKANDSNYEVIFEPISFNITSRKTSENGEVIEEVIDKFENYIERVIRIPAGFDPEKVTTGVVYKADGTFTHVPTTIYEEDGVYYAKIKSLENSIYILISNDIEVESVKNHWAKTPVNSLAKKLVINDSDQFNPERLITRGSFAEYITKSIGVYSSDIEITQKFLDVDSNNEYSKAISIANDYDIISGYPDGSFKPNQTISRQEAMAMVANAMEVIKFSGEDVDRIEQYQDKTKVSLWVYESVKNVLAAKVFNGKTNNTIDPLDTITYAEASTAIWNLLVKSELIER